MKIIIRPETPSEYNEVDNVIYEAFSGQHGIETGKFMKRHFADERHVYSGIVTCCCFRK